MATRVQQGKKQLTRSRGGRSGARRPARGDSDGRHTHLRERRPPESGGPAKWAAQEAVLTLSE